MKKVLYILLLSTGFSNAQIVTFSDINFKNYLINNICSNTTGAVAVNSDVDSNNNGQIEMDEVLAVKTLILGNYSETTILDLNGLQIFSNLERLTLNTVNGNFNGTYYNFPNLIYLKHNCKAYSSATNIDVNGLIHLKTFIIGSDKNIGRIDYISSLVSLEEFESINNKHDETTIYGLPISLKKLKIQSNCQYCWTGANPIKNVMNFSFLENLVELDIYNNDVTDLILNLNNLTYINCDSNPIVNLNLFNLPNLGHLNCQNSVLESINLKDGINNNLSLTITNSSNFKYICMDEVDILQNSSQLIKTEYCNLISGGAHYLLHGNNRIDDNNNGCNVTDATYPNLKCMITNGIELGFLISNNTGNYSMNVHSGTHTITPQLENPTYYNVSPSNLQVAFPATTSPFNQNFCITPNGVHHDVEVSLIPVTPARPGFNATYKIVYKNKGNQAENGTVTFGFENQNVLDFVSCSPAYSSQNTTEFYNTMFWNYTNLLPFETREITVTLNLNSPTETPPVNIGDILSMLSTITPLDTDEFVIDNSSPLRQIVVGSFDPNDKTCIEGQTVSSETIGQYVHYVICFENTGTYPAENIVVKDIIDTTKFDINTLIPIKGSHNFETRISNNNKVEFIFENINLPFDDANNDGYVAFKVKTKPTLVVGDTFSNSANIYFDYNFPIVTNNYTTTIQNTLDIQENDFMNDITIYPNPVIDFLHFKLKENVLKIEVYDIAGRIISSNSVFENKIDLSELKSGNYIVKLLTDNGVKNCRIIKN